MGCSPQIRAEPPPIVVQGLQGQAGAQSQGGRSSPALPGCTSPGPIRHLFVLVRCQRLCRFPTPTFHKPSVLATHPCPPLLSRWDQTRSGERGGKGVKRKQKQNKAKKKIKRKTQSDSLPLIYLCLFICFPPPLSHPRLRRAGREREIPKCPR